MNKNRSGSRVQGSWSASGSKVKKSESSFVRRTKPPSEAAKTQPVFQPIPKEFIQNEPKVKIIRQNGDHILGLTSNGESKVCLEINFIAKSDADWMLETLSKEVQWQHRINHKYNVKESRLTKWFSEYPYSYSGVIQEPNTNWHPLITALMDQLNKKYDLKFNSVLANCYRDGHDSVDWHTDAEPALGQNPPIASISFGDMRNFELCKISSSPEENSPQYRIPLTHGSLLLMLGSTQHDWKHRVPKEYHDRKNRINLTFRRMFPDYII